MNRTPMPSINVAFNTGRPGISTILLRCRLVFNLHFKSPTHLQRTLSRSSASPTRVSFFASETGWLRLVAPTCILQVLRAQQEMDILLPLFGDGLSCSQVALIRATTIDHFLREINSFELGSGAMICNDGPQLLKIR